MHHGGIYVTTILMQGDPIRESRANLPLELQDIIFDNAIRAGYRFGDLLRI